MIVKDQRAVEIVSLSFCVLDATTLQIQLTEDFGIDRPVTIRIRPVGTTTTISGIGQIDAIDAVLKGKAIPEDGGGTNPPLAGDEGANLLIAGNRALNGEHLIAVTVGVCVEKLLAI